MTLTPAEPATPDRSDTDVDPGTLAAVELARWLRDDPTAAEEHEEATRAGILRHETWRRKQTAAGTLADVNARVSSLVDKLDLEGRRVLGSGWGVAIIAALITLDAIPLNWAAQAFGLNAAASWLVTMILLVASVGAMTGLELTRGDARRHHIIIAVLLAAYGGLVALRTSFLVTVAGESVPAALLQAVVLSAISAGLVVLGTAVMARTRPFGLSRARAAARRAHRAVEAAEADWRRAEERLRRHLGVLRRMLVRQPLYSQVPTGVTHPEWVAALERALHAQFANR